MIKQYNYRTKCRAIRQWARLGFVMEFNQMDANVFNPVFHTAEEAGEDRQGSLGVVSVPLFSSQRVPGYPDRWRDRHNPTGPQRKEIQDRLMGDPQIMALEFGVAPGLHTLVSRVPRLRGDVSGRGLWRKALLLNQQLKCGYQEEALFHTASLGAAKRQHLVRLQALEMEMDVAQRRRGHAVQESAAARAEHRALLLENHMLLRVLREVREMLEQQEACFHLPQRTLFGIDGGG